MPAGLDHDRVSGWLVANVPGLAAPFEVTVARGGHSNLTCFLVDGAGRRLVVRRPPLGDLPRGAHDVAREYRVLTALAPTSVPTPEPLGLCTDLAVTGAPFYAMEWVDGVVVATPEDVERNLSLAARCVAADALVDTMAELHAVDPDAVGLGDLGYRDDPVGHHVGRLRAVWERTRTRELSLMDEVADRLLAKRPGRARIGVVHGDYRLGNVLLEGNGDIAAVLDWELCTVGDVLVDVGYVLASWQQPDDDAPAVWMAPPPTMAGGFPRAGHLLERYASATGTDVAHAGYYQGLAYWRIAVIAEGIKRRYASRAPDEGVDNARHLAQRVVDLAELAHHHLRD